MDMTDVGNSSQHEEIRN